jgi:hypothetical protein
VISGMLEGAKNRRFRKIFFDGANGANGPFYEGDGNWFTGGMKTRIGKIARLSEKVRHTLNQRLADGVSGAELVAWLNGLTAVRKTLAARFEGRPISEQNLSEWRQGGYEDWKRAIHSQAVVEAMLEESDALGGTSEDSLLADRALGPVVAALMQMLHRAMSEEPSAEQRRTVLGVAQQMANLRRESHEALRAEEERNQWEVEAIEKYTAIRIKDIEEEGHKRALENLRVAVARGDLEKKAQTEREKGEIWRKSGEKIRVNPT